MKKLKYNNEENFSFMYIILIHKFHKYKLYMYIRLI